jgi:hypothetical protein
MKSSSVFRSLGLLFAACLTACPLAAAADSPPPTPERLAEERSVRAFIDGWYEGDADRTARARHPDLVKRTPFPSPDGKAVLGPVSAGAMIELTRAGLGQRKARPGQVNSVTVLNISGDLASAKSVSPDDVDLLHRVRINGEWRIINVLWQTVKPTAPGK